MGSANANHYTTDAAMSSPYFCVISRFIIFQYFLLRRFHTKSCVRLFCPSCGRDHIRKCNPPTAMCRNFCLLRFRPGPVRPSLSNLGYGNLHSHYHVDTQLRVDTRSTYNHRPQVVSNSSRSRTKPPSSWITSACHYTPLNVNNLI